MGSESVATVVRVVESALAESNAPAVALAAILLGNLRGDAAAGRPAASLHSEGLTAARM
jgi:hypothetical protein